MATQPTPRPPRPPLMLEYRILEGSTPAEIEEQLRPLLARAWRPTEPLQVFQLGGGAWRLLLPIMRDVPLDERPPA